MSYVQMKDGTVQWHGSTRSEVDLWKSIATAAVKHLRVISAVLITCGLRDEVVKLKEFCDSTDALMRAHPLTAVKKEEIH